MSRALLVLAASLCTVSVAVALPWGEHPIQGEPGLFFSYPQQQTYDLTLDLAGDAVEAEDGRVFGLVLSLQGAVVRTIPDGDVDRATEAGDLHAQLRLVAADSGAVVGVFDGVLHYSAARQASPLGLKAWDLTLRSAGDDLDLLDLTLRGTLSGEEVQSGLVVSLADVAGTAALTPDGAEAPLPFDLTGLGEAHAEQR